LAFLLVCTFVFAEDHNNGKKNNSPNLESKVDLGSEVAKSYAPGDTLVLTMDSTYGDAGGTVELDLRVTGFDQLGIFEGTIQWDASGLEFVEVKNFGVAKLLAENFGRPIGVDNQLTFSWAEPATSGQSAADSSVLFTLVFNVLGEAGSIQKVEFVDEPLDVSATDNLLESIVVVENDGQVEILAPLAVMADVVDVACKFGNGGSITLQVTGASGSYDYNWNNGATTSTIENLEEGGYSYTVTDQLSGSTLTESIVIVSPDEILIDVEDLTLETDTFASLTLNVSGGIPPYSYEWSNGDTLEMLSKIENGLYIVTVTDANDCTKVDSIEVDHSLTSSLAEIDQVSKFTVYPNPTDERAIVLAPRNAEGRTTTWEVYNALGERVLKGYKKSGISQFEISLRDHIPGVYFLRIGEEAVPIVLTK